MTRHRSDRPWCATALAALGLLATGCAAPFADLQGARLAGRGNLEVTGSFSSVSYASGGQSQSLQREYTAQLAAGTGERTDWRFRYTRIGPPGGEGDGLNVFGAGPKFAIERDWLAFALPVGFAFGEGLLVGDTFQVHPTMLFTWPAASGLDVNLSGKVLLSVRGGEPGLAANLGLASLGAAARGRRAGLREQRGLPATGEPRTVVEPGPLRRPRPARGGASG